MTTPADSSAGDEYTRRLVAWRARAQQLTRSERRISLNGRMVFDYRLRPGMVEKSNAVALMRAVGLDV